MANFAFGFLLGYFVGIAVEYYVSKIDREIKDGRR
jgi:hypothetical protein